VGVDLLPDRIEAARNLSPTGMQFNCGTAEHLSFPDGSFNLVLAFTVFTSILDAGMKRQVAQEMLRVLRDDGLIVWFDYFVNNPWNPDVRGVGKREIATLFPGCSLSLGRTNLVPPPLPALWPPIPSPSVPSWKALSSLIRTTLEP
jgi:SAM-dependent methyltransferase